MVLHNACHRFPLDSCDGCELCTHILRRVRATRSACAARRPTPASRYDGCLKTEAWSERRLSCCRAEIGPETSCDLGAGPVKSAPCAAHGAHVKQVAGATRLAASPGAKPRDKQGEDRSPPLVCSTWRPLSLRVGTRWWVSSPIGRGCGSWRREVRVDSCRALHHRARWHGHFDPSCCRKRVQG